jgi:hypothetical protein
LEFDMKTEEDEAFEDIERRQGGFQAKRAMAADKLQEFCTCHETHPMECQGCRANRLAQPAQEQRPWVGLTNDEVNNFAAGCHLGKSVQGAIYEAEAKLKEKNHG